MALCREWHAYKPWHRTVSGTMCNYDPFAALVNIDLYINTWCVRLS